MDKLRGIELKCAQLVPSAMFASPTAVLHAPGLTIPQKIAILRRWEFDARRSASDIRAGNAHGDIRLLEEVRSALAILGVVVTSKPGPRIEPARH